jgi:dipeptidyl aminopeptidase/acylaminoacyl peptidase
LISKTNRFKAASNGAENLTQKLEWIVEDTPGHVINFMQGQPWEKLEKYNHSSPLSFIPNAKTPALIHLGENDPRVPVAHAPGLYRALK